MKGKTIDAARLLAFIQPYIRREPWYSDPYAQPYFAVDTEDFWDFVLKETGATPEDLNAFLDEVFTDGDAIDLANAYLKGER